MTDTVVAGSDEGRQEIALDEDEYEGDENGSELGGHAATPSGDERPRSGVDVKDDAVDSDSTGSVAANSVATSIISKSK